MRDPRPPDRLPLEAPGRPGRIGPTYGRGGGRRFPIETGVPRRYTTRRLSDEDARLGGHLARRDQGRQGAAISTQSGALKDYPYGFGSRFEGKPGTNPEELIGAAHSGCFTMALSLMLTEAGLPPETLQTTADVTLEKLDDGFAITSVHLTLQGQDPRRPTRPSSDELHQAKAKAGCPVSKLLNTKITLDATLES